MRFNEAALFRTRKANSIYSKREMEALGFNEAALFRTRKVAGTEFADQTYFGFNEAALFRTRKDGI